MSLNADDDKQDEREKHQEMNKVAPHQPSRIAKVDRGPSKRNGGIRRGARHSKPPRTLGDKCAAVLLTEVGSNPSIAPVVWVRPFLKIDVVLCHDA